MKDKKSAPDYDSLCLRCGTCCGAEDGDPCVNLSKDKYGRYICLTYEKRLGRQKTVSGKTFECVQISENFRKGAEYPGCGYIFRD